MVNSRRPAFGRHRRATRRSILVAAGVAVVLGVSSVAFAAWTVGGLGTAVARTGTLDLIGARPAVQVTGQDLLVSWEQSRLIGRPLGSHRAGGYRVLRYDAGGHSLEVRGGCAGMVAGSGGSAECVEHGVPEGTWEYAVTPVLGGWTGTEGPHTEITVHGAALTVARPANSSATPERRPVFAGGAGTAPGDLPKVAVTISKGRVPDAAFRRLTTTAVDGSWSARPVKKLPEGVYTARARQADRAGHLTWSHPSTFRVDATAPATAEDTAAIGEGWKRTDQTVALRPADPGGSGVAATYVTTDGSTPTIGSAQGPLVSVGEGIHVIKYFSVDRAGNTEAVRTATRRIRVDETAPDIATLGPLPDVVRNGQVLTGGGNDALSGVARVVYERCAEAACTSWTWIGSSATGPDHPVVWSHQPANRIYQVRARVLDPAGNATTSAAQMVRVDNTSPAVAIAASADGNGTVDGGDTLTVEMSESLDPASLPAAGRMTFSRSSGSSTTMSIAGLTDGPVKTGTRAWVDDGASVSYSGTLVITDDCRRVRFTVGACEYGCGDAVAGNAGTLQFVPATSLRDRAGNTATGTKTLTLTLF
jgi:hypothetical protein